MAPSTHKRGPSPLAFLTFAALLFSPTALAAYAVLGVDLGTEYIKAALVKPGIPLEIVLTKDSKRKETSAIAFKAARNQAELDPDTFPERLYGGDALALSARIPGDVYPNLKHLLGASEPYRATALQGYKNRYPAQLFEEGSATGVIRLRSKAFGTHDELFTVEELLAMELKTIKGNAEAMAGAGSVVREAVFTIPPFYTVDERRAIERAAELADMKAIGLISDGLAVGVNYATSRTFDKPETHLIYDMGAGYTAATIVRFQGKTVKDVGRFNKTVQEVAVLGTGWDRTLGGDALNDLIVEDMIKQFTETKGAKTAQLTASNIKSNGRTAVKLNREAEKVRQVLSANTATSAFFEGLQDDVDFRYKITRAQFEEAASSFASLVSVPITDALLKAKLELKDIDSVILHGGAVRTPFVQTALEAIVGDTAKLKSNVNADEAAVFGAAFKAAKLSPSFRVKEIRDIDAATYPVAMVWATGEKERKQGVFLATSQIGNVKHVPIKMLDDFTFSLTQTITGLGSDDAVVKPVVQIDITNLTATVSELEKSYSCSRTNITTMLDIQLDPVNGLPELVKAYSSCESAVAEKKGGVMDGVKGLFGFGKDGQKPLSDTEDDYVELDLEAETCTTSTTSSTSASTSTSSGKAAAFSSAAPVNKLHVVPLNFTTKALGNTGPTKDERKQMQDRLSKFDKSDAARRTREETFNMLEGLTYRIRDMLTDDSFISVSSEPQRTSIEELLAKTSDWIHGEGSSADSKAIREKLSALLVLVDPIQQRKKDVTLRPKLVQDLESALNQSQSIMSVIRGSIDRAAEAASSAAEAAASSVAEAASAVTAAPSEEAPADELDEFESSATTRAAPSASSKPTFDLSQYTEEDYTRISDLYETAKTWLSEQQLAQAALQAFDEPVLRTVDLEKRAKQLGDLSEELLRKLTRTPPRSSSSKKSARPKTTKSKKSKASATASTMAVEGEEEDATVAQSMVNETQTPEASPVVDSPAEPEAEETADAKEEL